MAELITLSAERRDVLGKHVSQLRRAGVTPANLYGRGHDSLALQLHTHDLERLLEKRQANRLIHLEIPGGDQTALIRHVQREPRSGKIQHVDFMVVEMSRPIRARVPLRLVGEAPAVRQLDGVLLHVVDALEVECLPRDLPEAFRLDIGGLDKLEASLPASEVQLPPGVTLLTDASETVVKITTPRRVVEEAPAAAATPAAGEAPAQEKTPEV
jgi:large subunit ribosomal protein L25